MEDYFFSTVEENTQEKKAYVLIIYDIVDNAKRVRLAKFLQGYGFRVQKSAFEALISFRCTINFFGKLVFMLTKKIVFGFTKLLDKVR